MSNQIIAETSIDVNEAPRQAENAQKTANDAKDLAGTADNNIKNINDPNYLSPFEKPQLQVQMDNFANIYAADKDIATSEGIDFTAYDAAYQAYLAYMTPLIADMTTYSPIVRATFNSMVTAVQVEQKRFNATTQAQYSQQINKAQTDISDGQTKYKALQSDAETMKSSVAGIADAASQAISNAGFASNVASTASQAASSAVASAMSAESNASSAVSTANSTASAFGPVKQSADSALSAASSAVAIASSTASGFGKVGQKADSAFSNAMSAESAASSAVSQASSAAADSKDAKQIAGAVSQSYKTLTDGSTMTIAELEGGLAAKLTKTDLNGYATQDWAQNQIKLTADGIKDTMSSVKRTVDSQTTSINDLQADSRGFKDQFTTLKDTTDRHDRDISTLQASSKELSSNFDSLNTANGTNEHDISELKQTSKEVSSTLETVQNDLNNLNVGGRNYFLNSERFTITPPGTANWDWRIIISDGFWSNSDRLKSNNIRVSFTLTAQKALTSVFNSRLYFSSSPWPSQPFSYPAGTTTSQKYELVFNITDSAFKTDNCFIRFQEKDTSDFPFILEHAKLEVGTLFTDWSPTPDDLATVTAVSKISQTADSVQAMVTNNQGDIAKLQVTAKGLQSTVSDKVSSSQLTQLSNQLTNKISDLSSSTSSQFTQTSKDINAMVKKGDVVNQFNLDAGGALLSTSGNSTKIVFSSPNIIFDSANPVQIPNANIPGTLTGKTFETGTITATTKIIGTDIEAPLIHSPSGSFKLDGNTGDIVGASIHSANNSWGISKDGVINGATINTPNLDLGFNGTFTEDFDYTQDASMFLPKKNKGTLTFNHGVLQSRGNMQTYVSGQWGGINDGLVFQSGINNSQWTEVAPGYIKLDLFKQNGTDVAERTYTDPTGYYYSLGGNSVTSYLGNVLSTPQVQTAGVLTQYIGPSRGALRLQIGQNGKDYGLQVGSYARNEAVLSDFIYNFTTSSSSNVYITSNGHLGRSTSASKYKYNIKNPDIETTLGDRLLNVHMATWNDKRAVDSYAEQLNTGEEREKSSIDKYYGLIAEQLRDAGLDMFISYGKNHEIEGIQYDRAWVPLLSVIRRLNDKVNEYELRLSKLEGKANG